MAKKWIVPCKVCGEPIEYSDTSHQRMRDYGNSRPEYCTKCRPIHKKMKSTMGVSYFDLAPLPGADLTTMQPGWLGSVYHPPRKHEAVVFTPGFDELRFGLTKDKIVEIYEWLRDPNHQVVVVVGPTGSGKSTALPYWLMNPPDGVREKDFFTRRGQILITQPRILATEKIAKYLGEELIGSGIGAGLDVGFRHSKQPNTDRMNSIVFETDGTLINVIQRGGLSDLSLIMIDEAHERSINIDQILRLLKNALPLFPHLKLLIVSATINAEKYVGFFGSNTARTVDFEGRTYGYDKYFAAEEEALTFEEPAKAAKFVVRALTSKILWLLTEVVEKRKEWGDILAFLHGVDQIKDAVTDIRREVARSDILQGCVTVHGLYADLPEEEKEFIEKSGDKSRIRVIVSTNVAEASLTVEGVVYVVDSGLEFQAQWDPETVSQKIVPVLISKANAEQRWGRSGRTAKGEVHCLYTEKQFNDLMTAYPKPAILRSSMEEVILTSKAAGLDDMSSGWIDAPEQNELGRATVALSAKGALDSDGSITEYGLLVRYIPYPIQLADLIMKADQFGVAIEVATLLPIVKNGGQRHLLVWKWDWDAYTKRDVARIHRGLKGGCLDDIEFCLKVFSLWSEPLGSEGKSLKEKEALGEEWAKAHFVNHKVLLEIQSERDSVLETLYGHRKETTYRPIRLDLLDRVRILLAYCLPELRGQTIPQIGEYDFQSGLRPKKGSVATITMACFPAWSDCFGRLQKEEYNPVALARFVSQWEDEAVEDPRIAGIFSRLFLDQKIAIGSRFECRLVSQEGGELELLRPVSGREEVEETFRLVEEEVEKEEEGVDPEPEEHPVLPPNTEVVLNFRAKLEDWDKQDREEGKSLLAEVVRYDFTDSATPTVLLSCVPQPDPFDLLLGRYKVFDEVWVEVVGKEEYPGDFRPSLVVRERETGLEILVEPEDLSFTFCSSILDQMQVGTAFRIAISDINKAQRRVKITSLPILEEALTSIMEGNSQQNGQVEVNASVLEVRSDERVFLLLEWSSPEDGLFFLVSPSSKMLSKPANEYKEGQPYKVRVKFQSDWEHRVALPRISKKAHSLLGWEQGNLAWKGGQVLFRGRMTQDQLFQFRSYDKDKNFRRALDRLYAASNQLLVTKVIDSGWGDRTLQNYPVGGKVLGKVIGVWNMGLRLQIAPWLEGFVPRSMTFDRVGDPEVGTMITAQIVEVNVERKTLVLTTKLPENDPLPDLMRGFETHGVVVDLKDYGVLVRLPIGLGVVGLAHKSKNVVDVGQLQVGSVVLVQVLSVDLQKRDLALAIRSVISK